MREHILATVCALVLTGTLQAQTSKITTAVYSNKAKTTAVIEGTYDPAGEMLDKIVVYIRVAGGTWDSGTKAKVDPCKKTFGVMYTDLDPNKTYYVTSSIVTLKCAVPDETPSNVETEITSGGECVTLSLERLFSRVFEPPVWLISRSILGVPTPCFVEPKIWV